MEGTGRPLAKTFFLHCQRRHPELPKIPTNLPPTLDVESYSVGEEETCAAKTGDNIRNLSVSRIQIHDSKGYESVKWDDLVGALLLETESGIPPQRGELDDQAKCLLAFACLAADKTTHSEKRDPQWAKPSKDSWPIGEQEKEDLKQLLFHRVEHLQENQKREQWREKQLKLQMKWGTSVYVPEYDDDPSACTCEYQGPWIMSRLCHCHQGSTETLREVRELLQEYGDQSGKEHTHCCDECHGSLHLCLFHQVDPDEIKVVLTLKQEFGQSNLGASEDFKKKIQEHDPRVAEVLARYEEAFGPLPPPGSSKKLIRMHLELKPEFQYQRITSRGYPHSKEDQEEIMRQVLELVEAGMCEAYKDK